ncbi:hypothetical protein OAE49_06290 [Gammaproteobacteria bacterium]|nr:hypothetical protein [Gammaproteobacteria bacterium]
MSRQISRPPQKKKDGKVPKDACYKKVKARYKVFPSAYASGAIAKCRKVGASNWGNKAKKMADGGLATMEPQSRKRKVKNQPKNGMIARGCGAVLEGKRKATRFV